MAHYWFKYLGHAEGTERVEAADDAEAMELARLRVLLSPRGVEVAVIRHGVERGRAAQRSWI